MNPDFFIVGLGNIGRKYENTRHNLGFELLNRLAGGWGIRPESGRGDYFEATKTLKNGIIRLIWPTTYMNNSGLAVRQVLEQYAVINLSDNNLLILFDDLSLPLGKIQNQSQWNRWWT